jgi:large subunit ribosomal protein L22
MKAVAKQKNIMVTPRKLRRSCDLVRGQYVLRAYAILKSSPLRANEIVLKKLTEAVANAQVLYGVSPESLRISRLVVDEAPTFKRFKPRAQGRMYQRLRRTSHITLEVSYQ